MITKDLLIGQMIHKHPQTARTLMEYGMGCVMCPSSQMETLEEAAMVHGMDLEGLLKALNESVDAE
ncbi:DUF1858 domain-containing protein [Peptoniphilus sp. GNH]|nr:hydrid cluster protein-associated redox disulfide domain protein [Clostridiales bacterium KA00134]UHR02527.1 DUF1858 domain-containing protein [Peptoniphilus sp. GNH]